MVKNSIILIVIFFTTYSFHSYGQKEIIIKKTQKQDSLKYEKNKGISIEIGHHFLIATQSGISKNRDLSNGRDNHYTSIKFPVDTIAIYNNDLIINRRYFPTLSVDFNFHGHKLLLEGTYTNFKNTISFAEDFGTTAHFNSKEYYILLGYSYNNLFIGKKNKINRRTRFYITANILFQNKEREFYYRTFNIVGGGLPASNTLNEQSSSFHITILPEFGMKLNITKNIYFKIGIRFNTISYSYGRYFWNYETFSKSYPQIHTYSEEKNTYKKILYAGENRYFMLADNIFFKFGYSFCPFK